MKRLLQVGFVLGLTGTLVAAYFAPWFQYQRYPSATSVLINGGRVEQFLVQLPVDRIGPPIAAKGSGESAAAAPAQLEHFKLRDTSGNVIGVAARHVVPRADGAETSWLLAIPSRGTVTLAGGASGESTIDAEIAARGLTAGQSVDPAISIDLGGTAKSVAATGEFAGIEFQLVETWVVSGLDDNGHVRGVLHLNTVGLETS
jgi:hypothetical protein